MPDAVPVATTTCRPATRQRRGRGLVPPRRRDAAADRMPTAKRLAVPTPAIGTGTPARAGTLLDVGDGGRRRGRAASRCEQVGRSPPRSPSRRTRLAHDVRTVQRGGGRRCVRRVSMVRCPGNSVDRRSSMELSLSTRTLGDHTVLEVGGEVDVYTAPRLRERLIELVDGGATAGGRRPGPGRVPRLHRARRARRRAQAAPRGRRRRSAWSATRNRCSRSSGSPRSTRCSRSTPRSTRRPPRTRPDPDRRRSRWRRSGSRSRRRRRMCAPPGWSAWRSPAGPASPRSCSTRSGSRSARRARARSRCTASTACADLVAGRDVRRAAVTPSGSSTGRRSRPGLGHRRAAAGRVGRRVV